VLYVTELVGLVMIFVGYKYNVRQKAVEGIPAGARHASAAPTARA
jgi:hypothetical protein